MATSPGSDDRLVENDFEENHVSGNSSLDINWYKELQSLNTNRRSSELEWLNEAKEVDSKPDRGLENIPGNLSNIKSKFEGSHDDGQYLPYNSEVCAIEKSGDTVMSRLAKYQSAVCGEDNENGDLGESDNDEEFQEESSAVKTSKHKEKVVFSGMSSLKSQWETGSVSTTTTSHGVEEEEEECEELEEKNCDDEELDRLRHQGTSMRAMYEKACLQEDPSKTTSGNRTQEIIVDLGRDVKAIEIKDRFERGELVNEVEEEHMEKFRKEKEEDLSVVMETGGIASDAKKLFKQIDATVKTAAIITPKSQTQTHYRQIGSHSPVRDVDVVKCTEPHEKESIPVSTTDVSERFKFFENFTDAQKESKRSSYGTARESSPEPELPHDPNVVRAVDVVDDIPKTDTARRMLDKFKSLEKESPCIPKPTKRTSTSPKEFIRVNHGNDSSPEPERDPNIVRASYKADEDIVVEADKAKSLRAKFENWDTELKDNRRNEDDEGEDYLPQVDITKNLRAKFEAIKDDSPKQIDKPKPKVAKFLQEQAAVNTDMCTLCGKKVYPMEKLETSGMRIHKYCFRCAHCSCMLRLENYSKSGDNLYCTPHFIQLFISRGNYDEGFGREQHKEKWNRSCKDTSIPKNSQENEDLELSNGDVQCLEQTA